MPVLRSICVDMGTFGAPRGIASQVADLVAVADLRQMAAFTDNSRFLPRRPLPGRGGECVFGRSNLQFTVCLRSYGHIEWAAVCAGTHFCGRRRLPMSLRTGVNEKWPFHRRLCPRLRRRVKLFSAADPLRCRCRPEQMPVLPRDPRSFGKSAAQNWPCAAHRTGSFNRQIGGIHRIVSRPLVAIAIRGGEPIQTAVSTEICGNISTFEPADQWPEVHLSPPPLFSAAFVADRLRLTGKTSRCWSPGTTAAGGCSRV
jgi:hypothetical protein